MTAIKAAHLTDLRTALDQARASIPPLPAILYTTPNIVPGTSISTADINDLRNGVR